MGCQGVQAVLDAGYGIAAISLMPGNPAGLLAPSGAGGGN